MKVKHWNTTVAQCRFSLFLEHYYCCLFHYSLLIFAFLSLTEACIIIFFPVYFHMWYTCRVQSCNLAETWNYPFDFFFSLAYIIYLDYQVYLHWWSLSCRHRALRFALASWKIANLSNSRRVKKLQSLLITPSRGMRTWSLWVTKSFLLIWNLGT